MKMDILPLLDRSPGSVLVLGCGYNYPDVILWSIIAKEVVGLDIRKSFWKDGFWSLYRELRANRYGRIYSLAKTWIDRRTCRSYFKQLKSVTPFSFDEQDQNLLSYNGSHLPFPSEHFDVVCSNAILEHVKPDDLAVLGEEIPRVLKPGGVSYHLWHNYYSLTGSHVPEQTARRHAWGHLLGDPEVLRRMKSSSYYLNRLKPEEILASISKGLICRAYYGVDRNHRKNGLNSDFRYEGEDLFPEVKARLSDYPKDLLLTRAFLFIGAR